MFIKDVTVLPCIVCGTVLTDGTAAAGSAGHGGGATSVLYGGVICQTSGNYGSQVFDCDGVLLFALCDKCVLRESLKMVHVTKLGKDLDGISGRQWNGNTECSNASGFFREWLRYMKKGAYKTFVSSSTSKMYEKFRDCLNHN